MAVAELTAIESKEIGVMRLISGIVAFLRMAVP